MFLTSGVNKIVPEGHIQLVILFQESSNNVAVTTSQVFCVEISKHFDGVLIDKSSIFNLLIIIHTDQIHHQLQHRRQQL